MATSENEQVQERTPQPPVELEALGTRLLEEAADTGDGRTAVTLTPGGGANQTMLAVRAGRQFGPESWNGPATLQILRGEATVAGDDAPLGPNTWTILDEGGTVITAEQDLVALLTVVPEDR